MKSTPYLLVLCGSVALAASSSLLCAGSPGDYVIASRDQNSQLLQRVSWSTNEDNEVIATTNLVTQIETGLNYRDPNSGAWLPSEEVIELLPGGTGAVARKAPHTVVFPPSLYNGVIQLTMPEGTILRSRPTMLSFIDGERSVLLAELKADSMGYLLPSGNQVIYPDAFSDGIIADILLTFTKSGLEADVVFRRPLPEGPEDFGLRPDSCRLQLLTEFFDTAAPAREFETISPRDGLADSILRFGSMAMVRGKGFSVGTPAADQATIPVYKSWQILENRSFLVEEIPWRKIEPQLKLLAAASTPRVQTLAAAGSELRRASPHRRLPPPRLAQATTNTIQLAKADLSAQPGFILDYTILSSTNTLLKSDVTYFVSGSVSINNLVIEGGTIVKFTNSTSAKITVTGTIDCRTTSPYRPAVFTHYLDNTVGETIATGTITNYYGTGLQIDSTANALHDLRFSYASSAVTLNFGPGQISLTNLQFVSCGSPINMTSGENTILMNNALCYAVSNVIKGGYDNIFRGQHLTVNQCNDKFFKVGNGNHSGELYLTNSILAEVSQLGDADIEEGSHNVFYNCTMFGSNPFTNSSNPFQTVGAGSHYLVDGSTNRNSGTTNISASLLTALRTKTTYPPVEITTNITANTTLSIQALRDSDSQPDLGFHSDPLDFVVSGRSLTATLTLTNGVTLGTYGAASSYGLSIGNNGSVVSEGSPTALNRIVRYNTAQEQATTNWSASTVAPSIKFSVSGAAGQFRFTGWSLLGGSGDHCNCTVGHSDPVTFTDCQFGGGTLTLAKTSVNSTNCLWERVAVKLDDNHNDPNHNLFNNLFVGGKLDFNNHNGDGTNVAHDNLFDQTTLSGTADIHSNNAYVSGANRFTPTNANDVVLTNSPVYQTGALGKYYYPTNDGMLSLLLDAGSRTPAQAGLFHYTCLTNQTKEADSSAVEIGFHYVALNPQLSTLNPMDTDGDGLADYIEDQNGNGVVDLAETSYLDPDTDYDGRNDGQELIEGTDPLDPNSMEPVRLGYWRFNTSDFMGESGQLPLVATNVQWVSSFDGSAVQITNSSGILKYNCSETNGQPNINFRNGSIRFMFKPMWSSTNIAGGTGPGALTRFFALGQYAVSPPINGCFILNLDATGTVMGFVSQNSEGTDTPTTSEAVSFTSNQWHEVTLTFTTNRLDLWINGTRKGFPTGVAHPPPAATRAQGFVIGNDISGGGPVQGMIDEFETFNYHLDLIDAFKNGRFLTAIASNSPPRIELRWRTDANASRSLYRKQPSDTNWTTVLTNYSGWSYTDTNVTLGQEYEYQMPSGLFTWTNFYIQAGISLPPVENRGRVILLVDNTVTNALATELDQLKTDLVGDGWTVLRHDVPRHDDSVWSNNTNNIASIKSTVTNDYYADTNNTRTIFIVGHVAVPYSGFYAEDGHTDPGENHFGAWGMDIYYGDVDGIYTDTLAYPLAYPLLFPENTNSIGDGKFDQNTVPTNSAGIRLLELSVGRIDFARMPAFSNASPAKSEIDLLRQYLSKDHRYRHKQTIFSDRAVATGHFLNAEDAIIYDNARINGSRWFGFESGNFIQDDCFTQKLSFIWGLQAGHGAYNAIEGGNPWSHTTSDLANPANESNIGFYLLLGSIFGDWNLEDNFMRATLGTTNYGLACMWVRPFNWRLERMGLGETLGDGLLTTANDPIECPSGGGRVLAIMGDPTLRIHVSAPPAGLSGATNSSGNVVLNWSASTEPNATYHVYRSTSMNGSFTRLTTTPTPFTSFTETSPPAGQKVYQVRTVNLINSGSGSYTNLSQGIFTTIN